MIPVYFQDSPLSLVLLVKKELENHKPGMMSMKSQRFSVIKLWLLSLFLNSKSLSYYYTASFIGIRIFSALCPPISPPTSGCGEYFFHCLWPRPLITTFFLSCWYIQNITRVQKKNKFVSCCCYIKSEKYYNIRKSNLYTYNICLHLTVVKKLSAFQRTHASWMFVSWFEKLYQPRNLNSNQSMFYFFPEHNIWTCVSFFMEFFVSNGLLPFYTCPS